MDANFCLKNTLVSNWSTNLGLGIGWAYMMPRAGYKGYALSQVDEDDVHISTLDANVVLMAFQISTCIGFQVLAKVTM